MCLMKPHVAGFVMLPLQADRMLYSQLALAVYGHLMALALHPHDSLREHGELVQDCERG